MTFESKRIYELHIFKDTNKTNWSQPSVHIFPLSAKSFPRFNRADSHSENRYNRRIRPEASVPYTSRDGLLNLWKCGSEQLSFLQKHVDQRNEEVMKNFEKMHKENTKLKEEDKKYNDEERKKYAAEIEIWREKTKQEWEERRKGDDSLPPVGLGPIPRPVPPSPSPPPIRNRRLPRGRSISRSRRHSIDEFPTSLIPPKPQLRKPRINPSIYETTWTLESVELDLQPYEMIFQTDEDRGYWKPMELEGDKGKKKKGSWQKGSVKISKYELSEQGKHEFAIVLSRLVAVRGKPPPEPAILPYNRNRSLSPYFSSNAGALSPERSVCGEEYEVDDDDEDDEEKKGEKTTPTLNDNSDTDEEEDHDIEVVPSPNETSASRLEEEKRGD